MTTLIPKFKQPYTDAVNRPINEKLQESVSVVDFGADPTGVTDSYAAFLAAYNSGAGTITIPLGTFKLTQTLLLDRAITFVGATSAGTRDLIATNTSLISFTGSGAAFECTATNVNGTRNFHFNNLSITGTASGSCGILLGNTLGAYATMSSIINVQITGFTAVGACGVQAKYCLNSYFRNVSTFFNYDGIKCQGDNTTLTFDTCWSYGNNRYGWFLDNNLVSGNFINCIAENSGDSGLYISGAVSSSNFYGWHSESNCKTSGLAPQVLTNNGAAYPLWITFFGGYFGDFVGASFKTFDLTGGSFITWYNPTMPSYGTGFMSVTSLTSACNFNTPVTVYPNAITNNTLTGVTINNNAPNQYVYSLANSAASGVPYNTGMLSIADTTNKHSAIFALNGAGNPTSVISDPDSKFSNANTAGKINVYMDGATLRIGNNSGGAVVIVTQLSMAYF
jgi:hypothetical protein